MLQPEKSFACSPSGLSAENLPTSNLKLTSTLPPLCQKTLSSVMRCRLTHSTSSVCRRSTAASLGDRYNCNHESAVQNFCFLNFDCVLFLCLCVRAARSSISLMTPTTKQNRAVSCAVTGMGLQHLDKGTRCLSCLLSRFWPRSHASAIIYSCLMSTFSRVQRPSFGHEDLLASGKRQPPPRQTAARCLGAAARIEEDSRLSARERNLANAVRSSCWQREAVRPRRLWLRV